MKEIVIKIEKGTDLYAAYSEDIPGLWGSGETVKKAIESLEKTAEILVTENAPEQVPELKQPYQFIYKHDTASLLNAYKGILTPPVLSAITGINQKQIHHYASGSKKPRPEQRKKIEDALHELGKKLLAVEL